MSRTFKILLVAACILFISLPFFMRPTPSPYLAVTAQFLPPENPPQFVLISFDGGNQTNRWHETLDFAADMSARQKPLRFTYFLIGSYLLDESSKNKYHAPGRAAGSAAMGFSSSTEAVASIYKAIDSSIQMGHEIGAHSVGHINGQQWTKKIWLHELNEFDGIIDRDTYNIIGFRAPNLGHGSGLYAALGEKKYTYDASMLSVRGWPIKDSNGVWRIPVSIISRTTHLSAMDYDLWRHQTNNKSTLKKSTPAWSKAKEEVVAGYMKLFEQHYAGNRSPISILHHLPLWNDGVYWEALKEFAENVCGLPDVRCATHRELVEYMSNN